MPVSELTRAVVMRLKAGRVISIATGPIKPLSDPHSLILLSQIIYWTQKDKNILAGDGWFSKPTQEWVAETGLTKNYVASGIKTLQDHRVLKVWRRLTKTAPWFKLDLGQLHALCHGRAPNAEISLSQFIGDANCREGIIGKALPYYSLLTDVTGDALLGLFLSRCVSWQEALEQRNRLNPRKPTWGWSAADWANDIGISRTQLRRMLKQASDRKLIEVTTVGRPFPGIWVDFDQLLKAINVPVTECFIHSVDGAFRDANSNSEGKPFQDKSQTKNDQGSEGNALPECEFTQGIDGFEQSTRVRGVDYVHEVDYVDKTTTTARTNSGNEDDQGVVVVALIFPESLTNAQREGIGQVIATALPHRQQDLLDELAELIARKIPRNPISYLREIVRRDNEAMGRLILEYAHITRECRQRQAAVAKARSMAEATPKPENDKPENDEDRRKRSDAARARFQVSAPPKFRRKTLSTIPANEETPA
jgi:hypothetical protein